MTAILHIEDIRALLPHRYPMLLVDRILEIEPGKKAIGLKNVTINEPFFQGHFPEQAVMPGVLIIESMAQVAGIMMLMTDKYHGKIPFIAEIENTRFLRPVVPGDTLTIETKLLWERAFYGKVNMIATVEGKIVAKCDMKFALKDPPQPSSESVRNRSIRQIENKSDSALGFKEGSLSAGDELAQAVVAEGTGAPSGG